MREEVGRSIGLSARKVQVRVIDIGGISARITTYLCQIWFQVRKVHYKLPRIIL